MRNCVSNVHIRRGSFGCQPLLYIGARLPALYRTMYNVITSIVMSNLCRFCITAAILDFRALDREKMAPFFLMFMSYSNRIRRVFAFTKNTRIFVSLQMSLHYQPATTEDNVTMHSTLKTPDWKSRQQYSSLTRPVHQDKRRCSETAAIRIFIRHRVVGLQNG